jgi:hypothetical protein
MRFSCSNFQAYPLVNSWIEDSIENFIPISAGAGMKINDDFSMLKEHRRIKKETAAASHSNKLQKDEGPSVFGDSRKRRSEFNLNEDSEGVAEVKNISKNVHSGTINAEVQSEKSSASETEVRSQQPEGDSSFNTWSSVSETRSAQSADDVTEKNTPNSKLSMSKGTSVGNTAGISKDPRSVIDVKKADKFHEDPSEVMTADSNMKNLENNAMSKPLKSSFDTEVIDIPLTDDESQRMLKIRGVEDMAALHDLFSENYMSGLRGVENEDPLAEVYGSNLHSTVGNTGFNTGLLSDIDHRQAIEDNVTNHMTDMRWNNYNTMPSHNIEAFFRQFRPYINTQISESLQHFPEQTAPMSLESFHSGIEPRYVAQDQPSLYYTYNAGDVENLKDTWNSRSQMCMVPCRRENYFVQPYAYGVYVAGSDPNYVTGVQVPQVNLSPAYLPPLQFPDTHSGAAVVSSVETDDHGSHANANQNTHNKDYAVTSNVYGGSSQGSHSYAGVSHSHIKEPLRHLEYSVTTPQKVLHTSLILKAPLVPAVHPLHPHQYVHPQIHFAEKNNINLQKSTYF